MLILYQEQALSPTSRKRCEGEETSKGKEDKRKESRQEAPAGVMLVGRTGIIQPRRDF